MQQSALTDVALPVALAVIMLGMGMTLSYADFARIRRMPVAVVAGVAGQFVALPALALLVAFVFTRWLGLAPEFALGLLLLACCPGGATSNLLAYLARADAALSVTLTSITSLAAALVTPATFFLTTVLLLGDASTVRVGFLEMAALVALLVVVPIGLGMEARRRFPRVAARAERPVRLASIALFAAIVLGLIVAHRDIFLEGALRTVPATLTLNVLALAAGYGAARIARLRTAQARTISIEVGFQNATLAITLALTQLAAPAVAVVPGFYSLVMFATGGALAWWWARRPA